MNYVDNNEQTIISIATGTSGLENGIERSGFKLRVAAFVEIEAFIIANMVAAMEAGKMANAPIWADVKTFPAKHFRNKIHGITAGYPCQPFSNAGKRNGTSDPRHIFPDILRIVRTVKPVWCFFENVEGHISLGLDQVYKSLRDLGYKIEAGIFSAEEVGAPHQRKRLFILAIKMEYANATKIKRIFNRNAETFSHFRSTSENVADTNNSNTRTEHRKFSTETEAIEDKKQRKNRKRMRNESGNGNKSLSNASCSGISESSKKFTSKLINKNGDKWVARPGELQYNWEEPRTIKSGMGCTINGYDFRIDLLRALGNGVVPQTAEKAFTTLLNKF